MHLKAGELTEFYSLKAAAATLTLAHLHQLSIPATGTSLVYSKNLLHCLPFFCITSHLFLPFKAFTGKELSWGLKSNLWKLQRFHIVHFKWVFLSKESDMWGKEEVRWANNRRAGGTCRDANGSTWYHRSRVVGRQEDIDVAFNLLPAAPIGPVIQGPSHKQRINKPFTSSP